MGGLQHIQGIGDQGKTSFMFTLPNFILKHLEGQDVTEGHGVHCQFIKLHIDNLVFGFVPEKEGEMSRETQLLSVWYISTFMGQAGFEGVAMLSV